MSNHLAIATVTEGLASMLDSAVSTRVPGAVAVHRRPDGTNGNGPPNIGINIFLYKVAPNPAYRSVDLPTRGANGDLRSRPTLGLDLHFLLSFHGSDSDLEPQRCMGAAVQALQTRPQLSREMISAMLQGLEAQDPNGPLVTSNLADAIDLVKFTPEELSLDEMSRLWSVFFQTPYALSISYRASVVAIEADQTAGVPLPVRERNIVVVPIQPPTIDGISPETVVFGVGESLTVRGRGFLRPGLQFLFGGVLVTPEEGATDLEVNLIPPAGVRAGVGTIHCEEPSPLGPGHAGVSSNRHPVQVRPRVTAVQFVGGSQSVQVTVEPAVGPNQQVSLYLTEFGDPMPASPLAFTISLERRDAATSVLNFPASVIPAGTYLVRLHVDGAASPLGLSNDIPPRFNSPLVVRP